MNVEAAIKTEKKLPIGRRTIIHLMLINNRINEVIVNALKPYEVSLQQFNVLRILRGQQGIPANLGTLNERMVSKMSNTTRLVDKLILKGYVERNICPSNRRKVEISITSSGFQALEKMDKAVEAAEQELMQHFSKEELLSLNTLLDKI
ncbi:MarR family winged helix-turn-helix transcriptional regulator [Robiginitalea sp. IMCC44478]|uniref:MarR family winged helix-turn-helix transcriptional regulator n=1 Tax=Robiginitalea sp. IMCC44478 TaxID=3459122 RepID=UPI0040414C6D